MDDELKAKGSGNYKDLDKTRVKLFPNFTRHHLITHANYYRFYLNTFVF